ncbi:hypothetical protein RHIZ404_230248 [Rhizobium sp. EC-SD404]|nr:hypothetical protein RHIZ404_230248 [Rhizobium sp. EC-SD404]
MDGTALDDLVPKSDYNDAKQFLSAGVNQDRMAYDRRPTMFPRKATF